MENASVNIPKDLLAPIIEAQVTKAVMEAMGGDRSKILESAISRAFNSKVDENGSPDRYDNGRSKTWLDWAIQDTLRQAALNAIKDALVGHKAEFEKAMLVEMRKKNSPLVAQLIQSMTNTFTSEHNCKYNISLTLEAKK